MAEHFNQLSPAEVERLALLIFAGATEATIAAELSDLIGPETHVKGMKQ